jgi:hypothetical protein
MEKWKSMKGWSHWRSKNAKTRLRDNDQSREEAFTVSVWGKHLGSRGSYPGRNFELDSR